MRTVCLHFVFPN
jgi:hypothetical protein